MHPSALAERKQLAHEKRLELAERFASERDAGEEYQRVVDAINGVGFAKEPEVQRLFIDEALNGFHEALLDKESSQSKSGGSANRRHTSTKKKSEKSEE